MTHFKFKFLSLILIGFVFVGCNKDNDTIPTFDSFEGTVWRSFDFNDTMYYDLHFYKTTGKETGYLLDQIISDELFTYTYDSSGIFINLPDGTMYNEINGDTMFVIGSMFSTNVQKPNKYIKIK